MSKIKHPLFNKTVVKQQNNHFMMDEIEPTKTRSYFKFAKSHTNLSTIVKDLQKNVKELKNYHESLQKHKIVKLVKSNSLNEIKKFRCGSKTKIKQLLARNLRSTVNKVSQINLKSKVQNHKIQNLPCESTTSKYHHENASTMLSIHNGDVEQVRKAYQNTYGRQSTNIVDLYNFFRKNIQKSTRIQGSMEFSSYPHNQQSEDFYHSRELNHHRKSNEVLNIIVEDKLQKQTLFDKSKPIQNQQSSMYRLCVQKNPTMEEIFKNGCPDLANVYDFVKKRRISLKNYINYNKDKQNRPPLNQINRRIQGKKQIGSQDCRKRAQEPQRHLQIKNIGQIQQLSNIMSSPCIKSKKFITANQNPLADEIHISQHKYLPSKSSKKSQKSSIKKSKHKQLELDQNICQKHINEFEDVQSIRNCEKKISLDVDRIFGTDFYQGFEDSEQKKRQQKFKKSKYYIQPIPAKRQNSLDGCSISVKSSSRIIELDFIPLDL